MRNEDLNSFRFTGSDVWLKVVAELSASDEGECGSSGSLFAKFIRNGGISERVHDEPIKKMKNTVEQYLITVSS